MDWSLKRIYPTNKKTHFIDDKFLLCTDDNGKVWNVQ